VVTGLIGLLIAGRAHAGINQWTSHGPEGGQIFALAIDPLTPTTLYAGTFGFGGGGGVFDIKQVVDSDGDGLPDDYEIAHGLNPNDPSDASKDADATG
jgi:hypothetical protein